MRWVFVLMFAGLGAMMLYVGVAQYVLQHRIAEYARPIEVEIIHSEVTRSLSSDTDPSLSRNTSTTTYTPEVRFRYVVEGRAYESAMMRPNIIETTYGSHEDAAAALADYPLGARVQAWVDDAHLENAFLILEKGIGPIVFTIVGLLALGVAYLAFRFIR
ncbi:DUF3592 domain-containing protein [Vitreimonas flagellata]|uniref:DUF3592 domain-containing protein n=1 Tax=Vitreimonas flagellata TaxID=2560861 RepID=UPI001431F7C6|nr:DUF3592 domain-containing protein [Vitreimonas flagellata]